MIKKLESFNRVYDYEPALARIIVEMLPADHAIRAEVYGQKDLGALVDRMAFCLYLGGFNKRACAFLAEASKRPSSS